MKTETDLHDSALRRGSCLDVFQHHGQELAALGLAAGVTLPLLDLFSLLQGDERAADDADADALAQRVLIVEDGQHCVALRVDGLGTIETARWEGTPPRGDSAARFDARQFAKRPPMVELGTAQTRRTLACLDLQHWVRGLHSPQPH